jgi:hypothetical protein
MRVIEQALNSPLGCHVFSRVGEPGLRHIIPVEKKVKPVIIIESFDVTNRYSKYAGRSGK